MTHQGGAESGGRGGGPCGAPACGSRHQILLGCSFSSLQWVQCDERGQPLPGAPLFDGLPPIRPGDVLAPDDAVHMSEQALGVSKSAISLANRIEAVRRALYAINGAAK